MKKIILLTMVITALIFINTPKAKTLNVGTINELVLINGNNPLPKEYIPENLQIPNIKFAEGVSEEEKLVSQNIVQHIEALFKDAEKKGIVLLGNSAYRSYESQKDIYRELIFNSGYVAKAGHSEHQSGLAIDITNEEGYFLESSKEAKWLAENCYKYGFIIRYPEDKEHITGIKYEPWHIRYVGKRAAEYIKGRNLTLEEYHEEVMK